MSCTVVELWVRLCHVVALQIHSPATPTCGPADRHIRSHSMSEQMTGQLTCTISSNDVITSESRDVRSRDDILEGLIQQRHSESNCWLKIHQRFYVFWLKMYAQKNRGFDNNTRYRASVCIANVVIDNPTTFLKDMVIEVILLHLSWPFLV